MPKRVGNFLHMPLLRIVGCFQRMSRQSVGDDVQDHHHANEAKRHSDVDGMDEEECDKKDDRPDGVERR
jgi:hypothetical protein